MKQENKLEVKEIEPIKSYETPNINLILIIYILTLCQKMKKK